MKAASEICTELGRVTDRADLVKLLGRAADLMDASGVVIWMGNLSGGDLRPAVAHGYAPQTVAKMPAVPKNANNAAAAAYRTGALQIVLARPGASSGALVAPLLTPDGCIGAFSAEIKGRGETSDATQALVVLFAAQLASVLGPVSMAEAPARRSPPRSLDRRPDGSGLPRPLAPFWRLYRCCYRARFLVANDSQRHFTVGGTASAARARARRLT